MTVRPIPPHLCPACQHGRHAHTPIGGCWVTRDDQECGCESRYPEGDRFLREPGAVTIHTYEREN